MGAADRPPHPQAARNSGRRFKSRRAAALPVTLEAGQSLTFTTRHIVQAYPVISFTADAGTELSINPYKVHYTRQGRPADLLYH